MTRRKGELSPGAIRVEFPHHVRFPDEHSRDLLRGAAFGAEVAPRLLSEIIDGHRYVLTCFKLEAPARAFAERLGGVYVPPAERRRR